MYFNMNIAFLLSDAPGFVDTYLKLGAELKKLAPLCTIFPIQKLFHNVMNRWRRWQIFNASRACSEIQQEAILELRLTELADLEGGDSIIASPTDIDNFFQN